MSSLLARLCPLPGVSAPLGGVGSLPVPSSPDGTTAVDLVKPRAKRPRATAGRWRLGAGALLAVLAPVAPRPRLGLLGVESPSDPACNGCLPAAMGRRCAEGWLRSPCPAPPPLQGCPLAALLCFRSLPEVGVPVDAVVAAPPSAGAWPEAEVGGLGAGYPATPFWNV